MKIDGLPVNFTISETAKVQIENLRNAYTSRSPRNPPKVLMIGWGGTDTKLAADATDSVVVGYYLESEISADEVNLIEKASGLDVIFFVHKNDHFRFGGKVIDHTPSAAFFLREPK